MSLVSVRHPGALVDLKRDLLATEESVFFEPHCTSQWTFFHVRHLDNFDSSVEILVFSPRNDRDVARSSTDFASSASFIHGIASAG